MTNQEQMQKQEQTSTLNLNSIMIGTSQPKVLAAFYALISRKSSLEQALK